MMNFRASEIRNFEQRPSVYPPSGNQSHCWENSPQFDMVPTAHALIKENPSIHDLEVAHIRKPPFTCIYYNMLQYYNILQYITIYYNILQYITIYDSSNVSYILCICIWMPMASSVIFHCCQCCQSLIAGG